MSRRVRTLLGVLIFAISIALLIWGLAPLRREIRIQDISPSEMQLPTPVSLHFDTALPLSASLTQPEVAL